LGRGGLPTGAKTRGVINGGGAGGEAWRY